MGKPVAVSEYIDTLKNLHYEFAVNECDNTIEVNGCLMDDLIMSEIRARMRAEGYTSGEAVQDAVFMAARINRYHPVRRYLSDLHWDGEQHIKQLASYFSDTTPPQPMFDIWLRKWLIGAVARAVLDGEQNPMLVLDGPQGIGKSWFSKWLCSPLPKMFVESRVDPDDKDHYVRLASNWIWEVAELGATTRHADQEALKAFISMRVIKVRRAYGRFDMVKPALANFIGTVNNDAGLLGDKTGNRRFLICKIEKVDWGYDSAVNVNQVWAEAHEAWLHGETPALTEAERICAEETNDQYKIPDTAEGLLVKLFDIEPNNTLLWTPSSDVTLAMEANGMRGGTSRGNAMEIASTLTAMGVRKERRTVNGHKISGYIGVQARPNTAIP